MKRGRWLRRTLLGLLVALAVVLALLVGAWLFASSPAGERLIKVKVIAEAKNAVEGQLELGGLDLSANTLVLTDVVLRDPEGNVVARVPRIAVTYGLLDLLRRHLELERVVLERPELHLVQDERGLNLARAVKLAGEQKTGEQKPSAFTVRVRDFELTGAQVDLQQSTLASVAPHLHLEGVGGNGALDWRGPKEELSGKLSLKGRITAPVEGPLEFAAQFEQAPDSLDAALVAALAGARLEANVARTGTEKDSLKLERVVLPAPTLRALLPGWPLSAQASLQGTVARDGNLAKLELHAEAARARVELSGGIDVARLRAEGLTLTAKDVDFSELLPKGPRSNVQLELRASGGGSSLQTLTGQVDLSVPKAMLDEQPLGPIELHATADHGAFAISELTARVPGASVSAQGQGTLEELKLEGTLRATDLALLGRTVGRIVKPEGLPLAGAGALSFRVSGPPTHPGVFVDGRFGELRYADVRTRALSLKARLPDVDRPLDVDATIQAGSLEVGARRFDELRAEVGTRGRQLTADLTARGFADVRLHLGGEVAADRGGLALSELQLRYPEATWTLQRPAHLAFGQGAFAADELTLEAGRQRLTVGGSLEGSRLRARAKIDNLELDRLPRALVPQDLNLGGELNLEAEAHGTTSRPVAVATVALRAARVRNFEDLSLDLSVKYEKDRAFGELKALALNSSVSGSFDVPVSGLVNGTKEPLKLDLAVGGTKLERLFAALNVDPGLQGDAAATVHVEGTAADPRTRIVVDSDHLHQVNGPAADVDLIVESGADGKLTARIDLDTLGSQSFLLLKTPWTAARFLRGPVDGQMFLEDPVALEGAFRDVPLEAFKAWGLIGADLEGKASITLSAKGSVHAPTGTLNLAAKGISSGTLQPLDVYATVIAGDQQMQATLTALRGQQRLTDLEAKVEAPVAALFNHLQPETVKLTIDGDVGPFRLAELQALTDGGAPAEDAVRPDGVLTAKISASGTLADPHARLHLDANQLGVGSQALGKVAVDYAYDSALSTAKVLLTSASGGQLTLNGSARLDLSSTGVKKGLAWRSAPVNASLEAAAFDPSFLSNVSEAVRELSGRIDARATAQGTLGTPKFRGRIEWREGRAALMGYGQYRNVHLLLEGTDQSLSLTDFSAKSGSGDLRITARADRKGEQLTLQGAGELKDFPVIYDDQLRALLTGRFKLAGEATNDLLFIRELALPEMHVELPEVRSKDLQDLDRPEDIVLTRRGEPLYARAKKKETSAVATSREADPAAAASDPLDQTGRHYTILVNAPRNLWVRGADVNAELGLSDGFRIEYGNAALLFGEIRFLRGRVDVLGRKFDVLKDSQVRFAGPAKLPYINVTAQHTNEREQVNVFATIRGQGKDVTIKVSSSPALSESEIYTLLATGRRTLKRGSGSSMTGSEAASVVGAYAASQVKKMLVSKVPLDVFSIEAGSQGLVGASLEAGSYLTDKLYLGSIYRLGADPEKNENAAGFRLEYQFTPRWSFETEYGTARSGGADLIWSRDY